MYFFVLRHTIDTTQTTTTTTVCTVKVWRSRHDPAIIPATFYMISANTQMRLFSTSLVLVCSGTHSVARVVQVARWCVCVWHDVRGTEIVTTTTVCCRALVDCT